MKKSTKKVLVVIAFHVGVKFLIYKIIERQMYELSKIRDDAEFYKIMAHNDMISPREDEL